MSLIQAHPLVLPNLLAVPFQRAADSEAWFAKLTPNDHAIIAEVAGAVAGSASLRRQSGRRAHVASLGMMVAPQFQGKGVGSALLGALIALADRWLDLKRLELNVFADNARALALYRKFGFEMKASSVAMRFETASISTR